MFQPHGTYWLEAGLSFPNTVVRTWYAQGASTLNTEPKPGVRPDPRRNGKRQVRFRLDGRQYTKITETLKEANRRAEAIEGRKALIKARKIAIPSEVDVGEWLFTDGQCEVPLEGQEQTDHGDWGQFRRAL